MAKDELKTLNRCSSNNNVGKVLIARKEGGNNMYSNGQSNGKTTLLQDEAPLERVVIFLDYHNLFLGMREVGGTLDPLRLRDYLGEGRQIVETFTYISTRPTHVEVDQSFHQYLRRHGLLVRTKLARLRDGGSLRCDFDAEIAVDVLEFAERVRPDIVVLGTGDGDFRFVAERLRLQGIRVEVAATKGTASRELLEAAHGFVDLGQVVTEISNP